VVRDDLAIFEIAKAQKYVFHGDSCSPPTVPSESPFAPELSRFPPKFKYVSPWRIHNFLDQSGQRLQRVSLLLVITVSVINPLDAIHDVTKNTLGNIRPSHMLDPKLFDFLGLHKTSTDA